MSEKTSEKTPQPRPEGRPPLSPGAPSPATREQVAAGRQAVDDGRRSRKHRAGKPAGLALRPVVDSTMDAESAWLRASVEAFEPRLRELEQRDSVAAGEAAEPGSGGERAWIERPDLGCGWSCHCCPPRLGGRAFLDLDRLSRRPLWDPRIWLGGPAAAERDVAILERRLAEAVARGEPLVLGAASDPYGGDASRRARTRRLLELFRRLEGAELALTTASPLVLCDLDLLVELDRTSSLSVEMVVPAADAALVRRLEPGSAGPGERLGALEEIAAQGIATRLRIAPLMPGLNAGEVALRPLVERAAEAGAADVAASPLRLPVLRPRPGIGTGRWPTSPRRRFLTWLAAQEPELLPRYRRLFRLRSTLPAEERRALGADLDRLRLAHGFPRGIPGRG